jgi:NADPH-dependent 2,4-dienoyl-CoA reductase/sulfur reductase-like enzyme
VASALLANGVKLMGRSFKYHRPRGVLTAGSEEPNALVQVGRGARWCPTCAPRCRRSTTGSCRQQPEPLAVARPSTCWRSTTWSAPFLGAGFYYKTFMWPRAFWERLYEPLIRRAAGLGALSGKADPD